MPKFLNLFSETFKRCYQSLTSLSGHKYVKLVFPSCAVLAASLKIIGSGLLTANPLARVSEVKLGFDHT